MDVEGRACNADTKREQSHRVRRSLSCSLACSILLYDVSRRLMTRSYGDGVTDLLNHCALLSHLDSMTAAFAW